ncbi:MAG TPA: LON peptidase substrate-binding domain-containing protein [Candidatus Limnocylindria bacterium]|jgi:ATP-dependent Lon protease|nr:LON peptidase substrate-binding domain-containing protein [Candidatus Limnocylindria bacterium]
MLTSDGWNPILVTVIQILLAGCSIGDSGLPGACTDERSTYLIDVTLPDRVGVMILSEASLFPRALLPLHIFEPRYRAMLADSLENHRLFCLAMQKPGTKRESPAPVATLGLVRAAVNNPDGTSNLVLQGLLRVKLGKAVKYKPFRQHLIEPLLPEAKEGLVVDALVNRTLDLVDARLRQGQALPLEVIQQLAGGPTVDGNAKIEDCTSALRNLQDPGQLADLVATMLLPKPVDRQIILQTVDIEERLKHLVGLLSREVFEQDAGDETDESSI